MRERLVELFGGLWQGGLADHSFTLAAARIYESRGVASWYRDVAFLARYLRQPIPWIEALTWSEFWEWHRATVDLVKLENGSVKAEDGG